MDDTEKQFTENVISAGATVRQSNVNVSFGQEYINISLLGVYPNYTEVETVKTADGRFINHSDLKDRRKVIILHKKSADILFGKTHTEPIGQFVNAGGVAYQVVGLYNDQGDREANEAYIPFSTLQTIYNKGDKLNNIIFTTKNLSSIESNEAFEKNTVKPLPPTIASTLPTTAPSGYGTVSPTICKPKTQWVFYAPPSGLSVSLPC